MFFDPATTFKVLTVLNDSPGYLNGYWKGQPTLQACDGYVATQLYPNQALMDHIRNLGVLPELFVQKWFGGLCIQHLPYHLLVKYLDHFFVHGINFLFAFFAAFFNHFESTLLGMKSSADAFALVRLESADEAQLLQVIEQAAQAAPTSLKDVNLHALRCQCFDKSLSKRLQSANEAMWERLDDDDSEEFSDEDDEEDANVEQCRDQLSKTAIAEQLSSMPSSASSTELFIPLLCASAIATIALLNLRSSWKQRPFHAPLLQG
eukprot:gnl/TRDRNA2_/TRDRNA2_126222_c0_seq1.p1 gnl/TRDRNA2_/TRDRNA2_126222_c0~~gnl/TRDRNA2_/TRDRNA2_126222_c0_seq1.p1  ORF type:complete len:263 (+),score=53.11 gnl/TRDRNA2_/TRDRNA2_126222_c0_seq1:144-932(+)